MPAQAEKSIRQDTTSADDDAAARAAGITRTQSAFQYGKDLWSHAWGAAAAPQNEEEPDVAAVGVDDSGGNQAAAAAKKTHHHAHHSGPTGGGEAEVETEQDEIANVLQQYKSEPRLGDARASMYVRQRARASAALGEWRSARLGDAAGQVHATAALGEAPRGTAFAGRGAANPPYLALVSAALAAATVTAAVAATRLQSSAHRRERGSGYKYTASAPPGGGAPLSVDMVL